MIWPGLSVQESECVVVLVDDWDLLKYRMLAGSQAWFGESINLIVAFPIE